jgi:predicted phosphodiesterase
VIADVLNCDFLLAAAQDTRLKLTKVIERRELRELGDDGPLVTVSAADVPVEALAYVAAEDTADEPLVDAAADAIADEALADFSAEDLQEVIDELDRAYGQLSSERDQESAWMCIPSIPILAILQSELTSALEQQPDVYAELDDDTVDRWTVEDSAQLPGEMVAPGEMVVMGFWGPKQVTKPKILGDPGWLWMEVVKAWYKSKKDKVAFGGLPTQPVTIADDARIVLVGDWGSGLRRARKVADKIRAILDEGIENRRQQHVIHLGDVYYTGSKREYEKNFLRRWPVQHGEDIGSFIICGNHDMYRGGHDYYRTALADKRFALQDQKSVFALRNDNWQFLGLDTAYEKKQISNGQLEWIDDQLNSAPGHRTTVLSHHPLWSAYEYAGAELCKQIGPILASRHIDAWFWGHEHRCLVYEPRDGVNFSSCVGHGGIPSYLIAQQRKPYPKGLRYDYRQRHGWGFEPWNTFGFAVLDLNGPDMHVRYIDESGTMHHQEYV